MKFIIKDKTLIWKLSFEEFIIEMTKKLPENFKRESSHKTGEPDFNTFDNFDMFANFIKENKMGSKHYLFEQSQGDYQKKVKAYAGNRVSVPAYVSGSNRSFLKTEKISFKKKPKLFIDISKVCWIDHDDFERQEQTMLNLYRKKEFKDVDLVFIESTTGMIDIPEFNKVIKCIDFENSFGYMSEASKISLANKADFLRRGGFKLSENLSLYYPIQTEDFSYGYGRGMETDEVKTILQDVYKEPIEFITEYRDSISEERFKKSLKKLRK